MKATRLKTAKPFSVTMTVTAKGATHCHTGILPVWPRLTYTAQGPLVQAPGTGPRGASLAGPSYVCSIAAASWVCSARQPSSLSAYVSTDAPLLHCRCSRIRGFVVCAALPPSATTSLPPSTLLSLDLLRARKPTGWLYGNASDGTGRHEQCILKHWEGPSPIRDRFGKAVDCPSPRS